MNKGCINASCVLFWMSATLTWPRDADAQERYGVVIDAESGTPIKDARISIQTTDHVTKSNAQGRFVIDTSDYPTHTLAIAAKGYYTQGIEPSSALHQELEVRMEAVPYDPSAPVARFEPSECAACHPIQHQQWLESAMSHAGQNTWVYDLYNGTGTEHGDRGFVYTRDSEHARRNPGSECVSCHAPERWLEQPGQGLPNYSERARWEQRGVSCLICHQIAHVEEEQLHLPGLHPKAVKMARGALVRYGTLGDVNFYAPQRMRASYQPQLSAQACGLCHQDNNDPSGDESFNGVGSETTFEEWRLSAYADPNSEHYATCVDCHTTALDTPRASKLLTTPARASGQLRGHRFEGTSTAMLEEALSLSIEASPSADQLALEVKITLHNKGAGHHVPTGVTMRHMLLVVDARGEDGALRQLTGPKIEELGGRGELDDGGLADQPGKLFAKRNEDRHGAGPTLFTEAVRIREDNRIPALGQDISHYSFELGEAQRIQVRAKVIYRRAWRSLIKEKRWTKDGHGRALADITPPHFGQVMESAEVVFERSLPPNQTTTCSTAWRHKTGDAVAWVLLFVGLWRARLTWITKHFRKRRGGAWE